MGNLLEKYDIDRITLTTKKPLQDDEEKKQASWWCDHQFRLIVEQANEDERLS